MRLSRMLGITTALLNRDVVTASELAKQFEVSVRTIYRDVEALSEAGVPVYMKKGKGGGISLMEDYTVSRAMISDDDARQLMLALQAMKTTEFIQGDMLLDKLKSVYTHAGTADWVEIDFSDWVSPGREGYKFETIKTAVQNSKVLKIAYVSGRGEWTEREIMPVRLLFKNRSWYLPAYCRSQRGMRMFRLSRVESAVLLEEGFDRDTLLENMDFGKDQMRLLIHMRLRFTPEALYRLYDEYSREALEIQDDGSIEVQMSVPAGEWIYSFILSFGQMVEVLSPPEIREEIKYRLAKAQKKYN